MEEIRRENHLGCNKHLVNYGEWILRINWCSPDFLTINTHTLLETNSLHLEIGRNCSQKEAKGSSSPSAILVSGSVGFCVCVLGRVHQLLEKLMHQFFS